MTPKDAANVNRNPETGSSVPVHFGKADWFSKVD